MISQVVQKVWLTQYSIISYITMLVDFLIWQTQRNIMESKFVKGGCLYIYIYIYVCVCVSFSVTPPLYIYHLPAIELE